MGFFLKSRASYGVCMVFVTSFSSVWICVSAETFSRTLLWPARKLSSCPDCTCLAGDGLLSV